MGGDSHGRGDRAGVGTDRCGAPGRAGRTELLRPWLHMEGAGRSHRGLKRHDASGTRRRARKQGAPPEPGEPPGDPGNGHSPVGLAEGRAGGPGSTSSEVRGAWRGGPHGFGDSPPKSSPGSRSKHRRKTPQQPGGEGTGPHCETAPSAPSQGGLTQEKPPETEPPARGRAGNEEQVRGPRWAEASHPWEAPAPRTGGRHRGSCPSTWVPLSRRDGQAPRRVQSTV